MNRFAALCLLAISLLANPCLFASENSKPYWERRIPFPENFDPNGDRQIFLLNYGWDYLEENLHSISDLDGVSKNWRRVDLPHSWNRFDATDNIPGYRREASWYRKKINLPASKEPHVYRLHFEGVNIAAEVYLNGEKAGEHIGGYIGFAVDITPFLRKGEANEILVKADNSIDRNIIPSQKSDFFIYGGITRDVWLQILPEIYINRVRVRTPLVSADEAQTEVEVEINNTLADDQIIALRLAVRDPDDSVVSETKIEKRAQPGASMLNVTLPVVKQPKLWSTDEPNLYTLRVAIDSKQFSDKTSERFGYRWFEFKKNGPFLLNGQRLLLRGTHRHEDYAGYANAMPDSLHRKDMKMIKELGANFVRLAHYPQDPEVYRACDELGLLVWDELPWCRGGMGGETWKNNTRRLLEEQINQNYNHPSIMLWSVGNEMYWLPDFENGDQPDSLIGFVKELNAIAHDLDPERLTTMRKFYDGADVTDVFSPSIWAGWYSGVYNSYEQAIVEARQKYKRLLHTEYGGDSHVGRHTENPITGEGLLDPDGWSEQVNMIGVKQISNDGDWSESYIVDLFDWHLMVSETLDDFTGNAQWAFKDFGTPLRPENPIPYVNQKGLVDRAGNPKDAYYVFKSYWTTNPKFCYIESHTWTERSGLPKQKRQVCVFSNCDDVRLFVNGVDAGIRKRDISLFPACGLNWDVLFAEGQNELVAVGYVEGKEATRDSLSVHYSQRKNGTPSELLLSAKLLPNGNYLIEARVVDGQGQLCLDFNRRVYFDRNGGGYLKTNYGTPTGSDVIEFASGRAAIEYVPEAGGTAVIEARTHDFKGSYILIDPLIQYHPSSETR
jgi:beta-galactosidase